MTQQEDRKVLAPQDNCLIKALKYFIEDPVDKLKVTGKETLNGEKRGILIQEAIDVLLLNGYNCCVIELDYILWGNHVIDPFLGKMFKDGKARFDSYLEKHNGIVFGKSHLDTFHATLWLNNNSPWEPIKDVDKFLMIWT